MTTKISSAVAIEMLGLTIKRTDFGHQYAHYTCEVEGVRIEVSQSSGAWALFCRFGPGLGFDVRTKTLPALRQAARKMVASTTRTLECLDILANMVDEDGTTLAGFHAEYFTVACTRLDVPRKSRSTYDLYVHQFNGIRLLGSSFDAEDGSLDRLAQGYMQAHESQILSPEGLFYISVNENLDKPDEGARYPNYLRYTRISVPFTVGSKIVAYGHEYEDALKIVRKDLKRYLKSFKALQGVS